MSPIFDEEKAKWSPETQLKLPATDEGQAAGGWQRLGFAWKALLCARHTLHRHSDYAAG